MRSINGGSSQKLRAQSSRQSESAKSHCAHRHSCVLSVSCAESACVPCTGSAAAPCCMFFSPWLSWTHHVDAADVPAEGGQVLLQALAVSDVRQYQVEPCQGRGPCRATACVVGKAACCWESMRRQHAEKACGESMRSVVCVADPKTWEQCVGADA